MKKLVAFVSLLVLVIACTPPSTNTNTTLNTNRNTNAATETTSAPLTEATAIAQEKAAWDAIKNKQYDAFSEMLATDVVEVTEEGRLDKAGIVASVKEFEPTQLSFSDWKFMSIDRDLSVITYTVNITAKVQGTERPPQSVRASTAWVHRNGKWLALYHQSTPVDTTPPPAATASPKTPATATPAASPAAVVTGPDPIANEKAVWQALKVKNYDGFASALAPDSMEVEPNGVFDKAGTVAAVRGFDFTKAEISDLKAVTIDADANLVVYQAKFPAPAPVVYHSTIWANRDGKWLAVFHQGTPVSRPGAASPSPAKPAK